MEQQFSTSKVTVEYFDPHDVYKLLAPGLLPLLPLRNLNWQSHSGPPRSIDTLHVELVAAGTTATTVGGTLSPIASPQPKQAFDSPKPKHGFDSTDGFQTQAVGGRAGSIDNPNPDLQNPPSAPLSTAAAAARATGRERRHQIPGLRRTPYLKVLLVRCDDNETYKMQTRSEIRDWVKQHTPPAQSTRRVSNAENHDAFEWLIVHVVIPNTVAATQPRVTGKGDGSASDAKVASRWRAAPSTLLEKLLADFSGTAKTAIDRVAQIRIGINDVPYDILPRVVPAVPSGYVETAQDVENAWADLVAKMKAWILSSFDMRVSQYEEDIKEKDAQRALPGWNFCTFFILKEGLARGFESVGLVEDALVGYDELSVGLDTIIHEQAVSGSAEAHGGALLEYTDDLGAIAHKAAVAASLAFEGDVETVDLQAQNESGTNKNISDKATTSISRPDDPKFGDIPISATRKPYRELILANNVSVFDFRCYIFARQIALLFRLGNASSTREELLAKTKEQQESLLHGVAPRTPVMKSTANEAEDLSMLAEVCRRTLEFIPAVSQIMRKDVVAALKDWKADTVDIVGGADTEGGPPSEPLLPPRLSEVVDNVISSFAFSVAQQILAQTSTKALPIPMSTLGFPEGNEPKATMPEQKTMMHPARSSSLHTVSHGTRPPLSPGFFPGPGRSVSHGAADSEPTHMQFLKIGLEELAARRAELYTLSRNILEACGKKRDWSDGWDAVPLVGETDVAQMEEISLGDDEDDRQDGAAAAPTSATSGSNRPSSSEPGQAAAYHSLAGLENRLLWTALDNRDDFYRLYESLTHKALHHYMVASHTHSVKANMVDLAVLRFSLGDFGGAASYFVDTIPFFAEKGWSLLELSMLVMYSQCLEELQKRDDYVKVALKLLSKAALAENERRGKTTRTTMTPAKGFPDVSVIKGFLGRVVEATKQLPSDVHVPLQDFFFDLTISGVPIYHEKRDGFSLDLTLRSLLVDDLELDIAKVRMSSLEPGGPKEIWLASGETKIRLETGKNVFRIHSNIAVPGTYEVDQIRLKSNRLSIHYDRERDPSVLGGAERSGFLKNPRVVVFHRAGALDVRLSEARQIQLDKSNSLDVELLTGWNKIISCDMRVRAATGGLRLVTGEAKLVGSEGQLAAISPEGGGGFRLGALDEGTRVKLRFPFTVEQDVPSVSARVEVSYVTSNGSYEFVKTPSVGISLALGVNVQDIFKHDVLFSRFTVSTASISPLRLFRSELIESELFTSTFGTAPAEPIMIFPRQPASLLYKIKRKAGSRVTSPKTRKTMYLKLMYSVLQDEIESLVGAALQEAFEKTPLWEFSRLAVGVVLAHVRGGAMSAYDLERAALVGDISTAFLANIRWEKHLAGLRLTTDGLDAASELAAFVKKWQRNHPTLEIVPPTADMANPTELPSILIPVDVPSVTVVHTADIQLQHAPTVTVNQLIPATLRLRWSRLWDTGHPDSEFPAPPATDDVEFSYEVTAPQDTWLLGGRRKGHFVIPGLANPSDEAEKQAYAAGVRSAPDTEADIPLLLVPLREGWLPFPAVDVREVRSSASDAMADGSNRLSLQVPQPQPQPQQHGGQGDGSRIHCETDYRNLGETVRVVADRQRVTLSLDASGPGGGPLVLESESRLVEGRLVI